MYIWLHSTSVEFSNELTFCDGVVTSKFDPIGITQKSILFRERQLHYLYNDITKKIPAQVDYIVHFCNINNQDSRENIENIKKKYEAVITKKIPLYVFNYMRNGNNSISFLTNGGQIKYDFGKIVDIVSLTLLYDNFYQIIIPTCMQKNEPEIQLVEKLQKLVKNQVIPAHEMKLKYVAAKIDEINEKINNDMISEYSEEISSNIPENLIQAMVEYYVKNGYNAKIIEKYTIVIN